MHAYFWLDYLVGKRESIFRIVWRVGWHPTCTAIAIHQEINNTSIRTTNQINSHALHQDMKPAECNARKCNVVIAVSICKHNKLVSKYDMKLTLVPVYLVCDGLTGAGRAGCGGTFNCLRSNEDTLLLDQLHLPGPLLPWGREYEDWGLKCLVLGPARIGPPGPLGLIGPGPWI